MFKQKPEVLVVGAGPVGLYSALALARSGVSVRIVDTGERACSHSYALGLHPQTLKLLQETGLLASVLGTSYPIWQIGLFDATGRRAHISLDRENESGCLAVLPQDYLEQLLELALHEQGVHVEWRHEVTDLAAEDNGVLVTLAKLKAESRGKPASVTVPFVIGADGHNSQVRRSLDIDFPTVGAAVQYVIFEFTTDADLGHELRIVLGPETTDVLWPLPNGRCRWSFQLPGEGTDPLLASADGAVKIERVKERTPHSEWGFLPEVTEESIARLIEERAPWFEGSVERFTWRTLVRFDRRLAPRFGQGRIWLAGDAAHLTGPAGVQSMNMGFLEGRDLADAIDRILKQGTSIHGLEEYNLCWTQRWRRLQGLDAEFVATPETDQWIAENAGRLLPCLPAQGLELETLAAHLGLVLNPPASKEMSRSAS